MRGSSTFLPPAVAVPPFQHDEVGETPVQNRWQRHDGQQLGLHCMRMGFQSIMTGAPDNCKHGGAIAPHIHLSRDLSENLLYDFMRADRNFSRCNTLNK